MKVETFTDFAHIRSWMLSYSATVPVNIQGSSSIIFHINELPFDGVCEAYRTTGVALTTVFGISCYNWTDVDGEIASYELNGFLNSIAFAFFFKVKNTYLINNTKSTLCGRFAQYLYIVQL
jgi:hypothetical protein